MACFRCQEERESTSEVLVMPTIKLYRVILCEEYERWKAEIEQGLAEGFIQVELCDDCLADMLCIK